MKTFLTVLVMFGIAGLFAYYIRTRKLEVAMQPRAGDLVMVRDGSPSAAKLGCDVVVNKVRERLDDKEFRIGKDSKFGLIALSGYATSFEAQLALELPLPQRGSRGLFGGKNNREELAKREEFLKKIYEGCSKLPEPEGSAIFRSIQIALNYMKARGCGEKRACELQILSDGLENGNRAVARYLEGLGGKSAPPEMLDNAVAAKTMWCGFSQASEYGGPLSHAQALIDRWGTMFTKQPLNVAPYCAADQNGKTTEARRK